MVLLLGFGVPFALYLGWSLWAVRKADASKRTGGAAGPGAHFVATLAAVVCAAVVFVAVSRGPNKSKTLSWSGLQCPTAGCQQLRIGGDPAGTGVGWPNGSFVPEVAFELGGGNVELQMQGGGGFVLLDGKPLNGIALDPLRGGTFAGYSLLAAGCGNGRLPTAFSGWSLFGWSLFSRQCEPQVAFRDAAGSHVATARLPSPARNRSRPMRLSDLIARPRQLGRFERLFANPSPVPMPTPDFMDWASSILVYRQGDSPLVHFLGREPFRATVAVNGTVGIAWPGRTSESVTFSVEPLFRLGFSRPYRRSAPVADSSSALHDFVLTTAPRPGDYAFLLPLGLSERDPRLPVRLAEDQPIDRVEPLPEHVLDRATVAVTAGSITLDLRDDAFAAGAVRWRLPLLLAVFVAAAFTLARSAGGTLHRVRLCGLLLGTWMLLMLRAVLALRYVFPPAPVDQLAVKGILFSFWPLLLLPLALAALAVGQLEANLGAARKSLRLRAMLVAVGALGAVGLMRLPSSLWRPLPERLVGPTAWYTLALAGLAFLLLAWIAVPGRARSVVAKVMERWQRRSATLRPPSARWRDSFSNFPRSGKSIVAVFVATFVVVKLFQLVGSAKSEVFLRDIGIHGLWLWFPAILWLGGLAWLQGERRMVWPLVWTVIIAALVTPFVADDPGSVVSAGAVFLALALILFHYRKAVWASLTITAVLAVGLAVALAFYVNIEGLFSAVKFAGNAPKYVLVYKHGPASTSDILGQSANLANAYQHNWENQAMVARGGVLGAGYGEAPARRSWVRQDTLQYDSVYAFFIAGDHGLLGGASLLGLYLGLLVLASRGRHAQSGLGAIAQLVYLAMALEAFVHAGMNVGLLPFAGRDLPLLAVASITDVMKWSLLVALAFVGDLSDTSEPGRAVRRPVFRSIYVLTAAFALACLGVQAARIASSRWKEFSWQPLLAEARQYIERGEIRLDAAGNIAPFTGRAGNLREESLLAIERERFQLATPSQRLGAEHATDLTARLYKVGTSAELNRALASAVSDTGEPASRPLLFRLEEPRRFADLGGALRVTAPAGGGVLGVNPLYDTKLSFERDATTGELPTLRFHDRLPQWEFRGNGFTIELPARPRDRFEQRLVTLRRTSKGGMRIVADSNPGAGNVTVQVDVDGQQRIAALGASGTTRKPVLALDYANGKPVVANVRQGMTWEIQRREGNGGSVQPTIEPFRGIAFLEVGDVLRPAQDELAQLLSMHVLQRDAGVVVGPAWVMGRQVSVVDPESEVPWLSVFGSLAGSPATVVGNYLRGKSEELTLDRSLQQMAQELVRAKGDELHRQRLARAAYYRNRLRTTHAYKAYPQRTQIAFVSERVLPPRVGLTILGLPGGEVAAMGSWPRADFASLVNRPVPEMIAALDRVAPAYVKARYGGDRNFDRLEVGSATKPLIAGAALLLQPELDRQLCVKWNGAAAPESEVFGIPIRGTPWGLGHIDYPGGPVDFRTYLQESSNLYQIRLGFLALAERDAAGNAQSFPGSPSEREAMTGCAPWRPWRRYPRFPAGLGFSPSAPDTLQALYDSDLAIQLRNRYGVGVRWQETRQVRESFWSAQAEDDFRSPVQAVEDLQQRSEVPALFGAISPETTNLELDDVDRPRELVSFLLGGSTNRWSNLDLAAAFATAVSGQQVRAHVLAVAVGGRPAFQPFPATSARLRPGLQAVWTDGTAKRLATVGQRLRAEGVAMYVKTGTAETESRDPFNDAPPTSRVLVALIRWGDEAAGRVERGVVLSLFAERAGEGTATRWMEEFLSNPRTMERLLRVLKPPTAGGPPPGVGP